MLLILLLLLVALNGLFVAAEIGLVRSRRVRLVAMAEEGERGAAQALAQVDRMAEYIAACQVGITLTSIGIGFLGEPARAGRYPVTRLRPEDVEIVPAELADLRFAFSLPVGWRTAAATAAGSRADAPREG